MATEASGSIGDVLSAASLLLAIIAVLYSLWYADITSALDVKAPTHLEDAGPQRRQVSNAIKARSGPLAAAALLLVLIFGPEAIRIVRLWIEHARERGLVHAIVSYDPVRLSVVVVVIVLCLLTAYMVWLTMRLLALRRELTLKKP